MSYTSSTNGVTRDLYVSTEYLHPADRVVIVDDFLAGGATANALFRICRMAGATCVGGGFLIEKVGDKGRAFLSGYQVPMESLAAVEVGDGQITIVEDEDDELTPIQQEQWQLDNMRGQDGPMEDEDEGIRIDEDGRISVDFTIGAEPPTEGEGPR